jgi:hypothetical protein
MFSTCSARTRRFYVTLPFSLYLCVSVVNSLRANPPVASYIFPAGGQRGTTVKVRVGGLYLYKSCSFELQGPGVEASKHLWSMPSLWFDGPLLPLPDSQQAEDYPRDMAGQVRITADAPLGIRPGRLWTAEGAAGGLRFLVGELPEVIEQEIDGDPIPVEVQLPVTINGRIFPREDVDIWQISARKGQSITAEVCATALGSPLDSHLEVLDPHGRKIAENDDANATDSRLRFKATEDGSYRIRIRDVNSKGGPAYVYRLTLTADSVVDHVFPLGGRRGSKVRFTFQGQQVPAEGVELELPADAPRRYLHRFSLGGTPTNPLVLDVDDVPEYQEVEPNDEAPRAKAQRLPYLANGRIDRPGEVDRWSFSARKGEAILLELRARQLGSRLHGVLTVTDAAGKELARAEATNEQLDPQLTFTPSSDGVYSVRVADRFRLHGGPGYAYRLRLGPAIPDFHLQVGLNGAPRNGASADVITLPRGGQFRLRILAVRTGGFTGPIALRIAGLPGGVTASNTTLAAGQNATDIALTTTAYAVPGTAHLTIHGSASLGGRTVTRIASVYPRLAWGTAGEAPQQLDSVLLAVALKPPFKIVGEYDLRLAPRGSIFRRRYRIERNGFTGPLEVSLADHQMRHLQGVTGPTLTIPPDVDTFEYPVRLPPWMETGRTSRACIQAVGVLKFGQDEYTVGYSSEGQNEQIIAVVETGRLGLEVDRHSITAAPNGEVFLTVRVSRGKDLMGPVKLELIRPEHVHGISAQPVLLAAEQTRADFAVHFAAGKLGPFNVPVVLRATLSDSAITAIAETTVEIVAEK